jgi:hypothetical protein
MLATVCIQSDVAWIWSAYAYLRVWPSINLLGFLAINKFVGFV